MANYAGTGTTATGVGATGMLPVTGGPSDFWFWVVVFVLISAGFAALRLVPKKNTDDV